MESHQGLFQLQLMGDAITCADGSFTVMKTLGSGIAATSSTPSQLGSKCQQAAAPAWAVEACKGVFLDLTSPSAGAYVEVNFGEVCGTAFLAAARNKVCWMVPTHSSRIAALPRHIQFLLVELSQSGAYAIVLPLLPNSCKATLQPARQQPPSGNQLAVHMDSGNPDFQRSSWQAAVYVAAGPDPFQLCDVAVAAAACVAGGAKPRWEKQLPAIASYLGWCTWDAFYHDVSAQGIINGLQSFKQAGAQPRWIIIDDGWQRTGLDSSAKALARQVQRQQDINMGSHSSITATLQPPLAAVQRSLRMLWKRLLRTTCGWVHNRAAWPLLLAVLRKPLLAGIASWLLRAYNRATSEHSKRLLSTHQFNAKFSGVHAGPQADTSTASTSAQVLSFVSSIKEQYGLKHVFAWHATLGYWSGVSPIAAAVDAAIDAAGTEAASDAPAAAAAAATAEAAASSEVVLPRVGPVMEDLEPPTLWSQLVLGGIGAPQDPRKFYFHMHSQLASLGITGVKVDVQNQLELVGSAAGQQGGQALAAAWHSALEDSIAAHFPGNALINCMCHNTSDLYRMRDSCLARVSDDFYPHLPASHSTHVAVCAFNSLFFAPLVQPDWDMFHSLHPRGLLHATARMISGGPVYVSDKPGRHDPTLLSRLALPGGRLLQPLLPGRPCRDSLFADVCGDGVSALKVWNMNTCGGVLAIFNVQGSNWSRSQFNFVSHDSKPAAVTATAAPIDVWLLSSCMQDKASTADTTLQSNTGPQQQQQQQQQQCAGIQLSDRLSFAGQYVLYRDKSGQLTVVTDQNQGLTMQLSAADSEVVTVSPLLQVKAGAGDGSSRSSPSTGVQFAVVGLVNMLNVGGAVNCVQAGDGLRISDSSNNGSSADDSGSWVMARSGGGVGSSAAVLVQFVGCGQLVLYCSCKPETVGLNGQLVGFSFDERSRRLEVIIPLVCSEDLGHTLLLQWPCRT